MLRKFTAWANSNHSVALMLNFALLFMVIYALASSLNWHGLAK